MAKMGIIKEFLIFLKQEKKWWLIPLVIILLLLALGACSEDNAVEVTPKEPGGLCSETSQCRDALCYRGVCNCEG